MCALTELIVFREYIFGGKLLAFYDIGSDTAQQYLPNYTSIVNKLRAGDFSLWDSHNAFGINMFLLNLTNPVLDLVYLIGVLAGTEIIPYLMLPMYLAEIIGGGIACYFFLSSFSFGENAKLLAAYMYAFNGFMIVWGQHYQFAIVCILLPLELLMTERCIRNRKKWKALALMTFIVVMNSMYMAYMILIFAGFFVLIRFLMRPLAGFFRYVIDVIRTALPMLLGVGLGCISLVPSAMAIALVSSRLATGTGLRQRLFGMQFPPLYFATLAVRMLSSTLFGVSEYIGYLNYYEGPCLFFTALFLILAVQYVFIIPKTGRSRKVKVMQYLLLAAAAGSLATPAVGVVFNGFTIRFCRWMFLYFAYFALIAAETLDFIFKTRKVNIPGIVLSAAAITGLGIWGNRSNNVHHTWVVYGLMLTGLAMCAGLLFWKWIKSPKRKLWIVPVLTALVFANAAIDTRSNFIDRQTVEAGGDYFTGLYGSDTADAVKWLSENDRGVYRIEKTDYVLDGTDGLVQGYRSISGYNSTQNANILAYVTDYWGSLWYKDQNHLIYAVGIDNGSYANQGAFCGIRYILSENEKLSIPGYTFYKKIGSVCIFRYGEDCGLVTLYPAAAGEIGSGENGGTLAVNYTDHLGYEGIALTESGHDGRLAGTVESAEDVFMVTTIPYEAGWSVCVDGQKQTILQTNDGFQGVRLSAGTHSVSWRYACPGFAAGAAISLASIVIFAGAIAAGQMRKRRSKK